jgi:D-lyxose ketol-isomerase
MYAHGTDKGMNLVAEYMTNTSRVPILMPTEDFHAEREDYPDFFQHVYPASMEAVLEPGDLLILPPGWWHAMRGEGGPGWSVSIWF